MKAKWSAGGSIEHRPPDRQKHPRIIHRPDDQHGAGFFHYHVHGAVFEG